ncbi:MAG: Gfo/Idh/MocA family oxidoreductase [Alphaproteobacteria bacterium]|nr:Gfo/Idh/MocA family oxidoreductase [Alphaproteobacteria bacterium]
MTTRTERLRGAVIGCGHMGSHHARRLLEREDVALLGVVDPVAPEDAALAALHVAALPEVDFAVVAAPTELHRELAEPLLQAGLAVLVEKPLAATPEDAEVLARYDRLCVGHIERFNPALRALPPGTEVRYIRAERLAPPSGRGRDTDVVADLMVHDLDLALALAGGEVVELRAAGVAVLGEGVDIADVRLETSTGCVASLVASRISRKRARSLRVVGEGCYWSLDLAERRAERVRWGDGELGAERIELPEQDALVALHDAFLAMVRGEAPSPVSGAEGARAVRLAAEVTRRCLRRL